MGAIRLTKTRQVMGDFLAFGRCTQSKWANAIDPNIAAAFWAWE
jgi:hypothetical protein